MSNNKSLALIDNSAAFLPSAQEIHEVYQDLSDIMDRRIFGVISIAAGGAGVFKILEPGADDTTGGVQHIDCVILASHSMNVRWSSDYGKRQEGERPICRSMNGEEGVDNDGVIHKCADCPFNQFGENGERKACSNKRQLYVMREGDILPMLLILPPSALKTYDNYRIRARLTLRKPMSCLMTRISLQNKKNNGNEFSVPVFTPIGLLPPDEAKRGEEFARSIAERAQFAGIIADDIQSDTAYSALDQGGQTTGFIEVDDEELPI